ncbi:serine/threonine protein kinase [Paenibacillus sp. CCS19]|uniref:serine/threonine-protein kinase n=1 Tax=Paenibacillus sp. CCS19 TaxID=3158387 RepID=UPI00256B97F9|nr:protein kinase [Paenibacillus cellulosilyticus]GMK42378.1 serine/threonine protein kinase [Paenibacillus cellulosilyticus]
MLAGLMAWWRQRRLNWMDFPLRQGMVWAGRYRIEQYIGEGSYGQAYRCIDQQTGAAVLLKRSKPSKRAVGRKLLQRESDVLQTLRHPQIPSWLGEAVHRRETALVMAFIEGDSLERAMIERGATYTQWQALRIVRDLLGPLGHLHAAGFVHRDVRIPNVLAYGERIYLIDYGLACRIGEELRAEGASSAKSKSQEPSGFADGWEAVKQRMRAPETTSDLHGLGHLFLFLMYAGYEPVEGQEERSWEEELTMDPKVKLFVRGLLDGQWQSAAECERVLDGLVRELDSTNTNSNTEV